MIFFYEKFYLKKDIQPGKESDYIGYTGENSIYDSETLKEADPSFIIEKTVDQLLLHNYLDIENPDYMRKLFNGYRCYFIYSYIYCKYCLPIYFTEEELQSMSENFKDSLWKERFYLIAMPEIKKLDLARYHAGSDISLQKYGTYKILLTKNELDNL